MWQNLESGVMVWEPPAQNASAASSRTVSLERATSWEEPILPSYADIFTSFRDPSIEPPTTAAQFPASSIHTSSITSTPASLSIARTSPATTPPCSSDGTDTEYESDKTDFLLTSRSPCPIRSVSRVRRPRWLTSQSYYLKKLSKHTPVRRKLNFDTAIRVTTPKRSKAPRNMRLAPEYKPRHKWSYVEKELLLVMFRWFKGQPADFAKSLNEIFNVNLSVSKIIAQWNYLRFYGPHAFSVYRAVFAVPFDDPEGRYGALRSKIERMASSLGISLQRLEHEEDISKKAGKGKLSKSPIVRRRHRALVKASRETRMCPVQMPEVAQSPITIPRLGGYPVTTDIDSDSSEDIVDSEIPSTCHQTFGPAFRSHKNVPKLAFRVWDEVNSKAKFSQSGGFVSEMFWKIWTGVPPPMPAEENQLMSLLAACHLHKEGGESTFISVSNSLLWALVKASSDMVKPRIAIIALDHTALKDKMIHTQRVLQRLKAQGQAQWARYSGVCEHMVWGQIDRESIIHHFSLAELISLYDHDKAVAKLLHLTAFTKASRTPEVASELRERNLAIEPPIAAAMGRVASLFGFVSENASLDHIEEFVSRLVDGWGLVEDPLQSNHCAFAFARALNTNIHEERAVAGAYITGIQKGIDAIEFYAKKRHTSTRRVRT